MNYVIRSSNFNIIKIVKIIKIINWLVHLIAFYKIFKIIKQIFKLHFKLWVWVVLDILLEAFMQNVSELIYFYYNFSLISILYLYYIIW